MSEQMVHPLRMSRIANQMRARSGGKETFGGLLHVSALACMVHSWQWTFPPNTIRQTENPCRGNLHMLSIDPVYCVYCSPRQCCCDHPYAAHILHLLSQLLIHPIFVANTTKTLDVFILLDESGSVGEENYGNMIEFVKSFVGDLDNSV